MGGQHQRMGQAEPRHLRQLGRGTLLYGAWDVQPILPEHRCTCRETPYFDQGLMGDIGIWTFAEAEVYNPNIAAGNPWTRSSAVQPQLARPPEALRVRPLQPEPAHLDSRPQRRYLAT